MADHEVPQSDPPDPHRSKVPSLKSVRAFKGTDLGDIVRLAGGAGVGAALHSPLWFLVAALYNIFADPIREFLQDVRREVGPALGRFLADRIQNGGEGGPSDVQGKSRGTSEPRPETSVGLWPVKTLAQARELQESVDAGHQPWLLSPEMIAAGYAEAELGLFRPFVEQVGPAAYQVRSHNGGWDATLYLAQPVRQDNGLWVVTRVGDRES